MPFLTPLVSQFKRSDVLSIAFFTSAWLCVLPLFHPLNSAAGSAEPRLDQPAPEASKEKVPEAEMETPKTSLSQKGPWGQLEYFEALLEAPIDLIKASQPSSVRTRWFFGKMEPDAVARLLSDLKPPQEILEALTERDRWMIESEGVTIFPRIQDIESLPRDFRAALYRKLGLWQENSYHLEPEIVYGGSVHKWLEGFKVSDEALGFIEKTSYGSGSNLLFADTPALMSLVQYNDERVRILSAFSRTPTLVAKLQLDSGSTEELTAYWNKGARFKDASTFLASMKRYGNLNKLDLVHLLPANIRKILFTFPNTSQTRSGYLPDCHWSSLNFFNPEPLERLCDPPQATAYTLENFTKVDPPYELGDVLFFTDTQTGDAYHSCAYIADDIVFTKNGRSPLQPWVLMKLDQVKNLYDLHFRTNTTAYRRNP